MTPHVTKMIREKGDAIRCEAEAGEGGGHAGVIVLAGEDGKREVLGRTDPTFETAEAAVAAMESVVETVRVPAPQPETEKPKKPKKSVSNKKKGAQDDGQNSDGND